MSTKSFVMAEVKSLETDDPNGGFEVVLSDASTDRDGEVVDALAFEPLPEHITFDIDHGMTVLTTVGSGTPTYENDNLIVRGTYSSVPLAQTVRTLVNEGHIRTTSVAFMGAKREQKGGVPHVTKAELLNGSFVGLSSNRNALVLTSKGLKAGARNSATDAGHIQAIHDSSAYLGADCSGMKAVRGQITSKAVVGSYEDRTEDVQEALVDANAGAIRAAYPNSDPGEYGWLLRIVATFDDRVVYQIGWDTDDAYQVTYTWDGETATITGTAEPVTVDQVVSPAPASDASSTRSVSTDAAAAKAAAASPLDDEAAQFQLRVRALRISAAVA